MFLASAFILMVVFRFGREKVVPILGIFVLGHLLFPFYSISFPWWWDKYI